MAAALMNSTRSLATDAWVRIYELSGENDTLLFFCCMLVELVTFLLSNIIFAILDLTGKPEFLFKYKIQESKNHPISLKLYTKALIVGLFNVTIVSLIFGVLVLPIVKWRGIRFDPNLPTLTQISIQFIIFTASLEVFFYYIHRLFHHPLLYSKIHKIHHQWTVPISISSVYCHPLEQIICNLWPIMSGPILLGDLCGNHIISAWLWIIISMTSSTIYHSGYHFPFILSPESHDFHHKRLLSLTILLIIQMYVIIDTIKTMVGWVYWTISMALMMNS
jgi:methylsterol monooxygenase